MKSPELVRKRAMLDFAIEDRQKLQLALARALKIESERALEYAEELKKEMEKLV